MKITINGKVIKEGDKEKLLDNIPTGDVNLDDIVFDVADYADEIIKRRPLLVKYYDEQYMKDYIAKVINTYEEIKDEQYSTDKLEAEKVERKKKHEMMNWVEHKIIQYVGREIELIYRTEKEQSEGK